MCVDLSKLTKRQINHNLPPFPPVTCVPLLPTSKEEERYEEPNATEAQSRLYEGFGGLWRRSGHDFALSEYDRYRLCMALLDQQETCQGRINIKDS